MRPPPRPMCFRNFYPGDARAQVDGFLATFAPDRVPERDLVAAVVPHAGWTYSGGVAVRALKALAARARPRSLLLLGAVHRAPIDQGALYPAGSWDTPFGPVPIDEDLAHEVEAALGPLVARDQAAHESEHSLEVAMPFLHEVFPGVPVVPILVPPEAAPAEIGRRLGGIARGRALAAVASTDLTHYGEEYLFAPAGFGEEAHRFMRENDARLLDLAVRLEAEGIPAEA